MGLVKSFSSIKDDPDVLQLQDEGNNGWVKKWVEKLKRV